MNLAAKYIYLFCFLFFAVAIHAQEDTSGVHNKIKIVRPKSDSVYVRAIMDFTEFYSYDKKKLNNLAVKEVLVPKPKSCTNCTFPINYDTFIQNKVVFNKNDLAGKTTDTVLIRVEISYYGKPYYKNITPLPTFKGTPAYYDATENAFELDAIDWRCLNAMKEIIDWTPASYLEKSKYGNRRLLKQHAEAVGVLTIVFYKRPFKE